MYKIAICDDEKEWREKIKKIIIQEKILPINEITFYEYESGKELLEKINIMHNLIFIDIYMPGMDGNKTAEKLRTYNKDAVIVFYSNYFKPTLESINIGQPFRYIMKDMHDTEIKQEMPSILKKVEYSCKKRFLMVSSTGEMQRIRVDQILYICLAKRGSSIYYEKADTVKIIHCKETLDVLFRQLADKGFQYAHYSYIVNLEKVEALKKNVVYLENGIQLNVSRSRKENFEKSLMNLLHERAFI